MAYLTRVFIAYSRQDEEYKRDLIRHLKINNYKTILTVWHDGVIPPGIAWEKELLDNLEKSDIILMLISSHSLTSEYFIEKELKNILKRHKEGKCIAIPIIVSSVDWEGTGLEHIQALPKDGVPISKCKDEAEKEAVLSSIAKDVKKQAQKIQQKVNSEINEAYELLNQNVEEEDIQGLKLGINSLREQLSFYSIETNKLLDYEERVKEFEKTQQLRNYITKIEHLQEEKNWEEITNVSKEALSLFSEAEVNSAKNKELLESLISRIESISNQAGHKNRALSLDDLANEAFANKEYEKAEKLWEEANKKDRNRDRIKRIVECKEQIRHTHSITNFKIALDRCIKIKEKDPYKAKESLEIAIQKIRDEELEASKEGESVNILLETANVELDDIKENLRLKEFENLLKTAQEAFKDQKHYNALNAYLIINKIEPKDEYDEKINDCRHKIRLNLLRETATNVESGKVGDESSENTSKYVKSILELEIQKTILKEGKEDASVQHKISSLEEYISNIDRDYVNAFQEGQRLLLDEQFEEARTRFENCLNLKPKPKDEYIEKKLEELNQKQKLHKRRELAREAMREGVNVFKENKFQQAKQLLDKAGKYVDLNDYQEITLYAAAAKELWKAEKYYKAMLWKRAHKIYSTLPKETKDLKFGFVENRIDECNKRINNKSKKFSRNNGGLKVFSKNRLAILLILVALIFLGTIVFIKSFNKPPVDNSSSSFEKGITEFEKKKFTAAKNYFKEAYDSEGIDSLYYTDSLSVICDSLGYMYSIFVLDRNVFLDTLMSSFNRTEESWKNTKMRFPKASFFSAQEDSIQQELDAWNEAIEEIARIKNQIDQAITFLEEGKYEEGIKRLSSIEEDSLMVLNGVERGDYVKKIDSYKAKINNKIQENENIIAANKKIDININEWENKPLKEIKDIIKREEGKGKLSVVRDQVAEGRRVEEISNLQKKKRKIEIPNNTLNSYLEDLVNFLEKLR